MRVATTVLALVSSILLAGCSADSPLAPRDLQAARLSDVTPTMLPAPVLLSAVAGATVDGNVQIQITWQQYTGATGYYSPVLVANIANSAGLNIAGGPVAWEQDVATVTTATVLAPSGSGVVSINLSGFAYTLPETDPNFNGSLIWIAQSNVITVDTSPSPAGVTKPGHGKQK